MNLIIHIFGVPIHRHDSLYGMTKHHGSQIKLSREQWKGFFYREPPFNYGISKVLNAANVARIYIRATDNFSGNWVFHSSKLQLIG